MLYYTPMRILTVIPITNSSWIDELTYFSLSDVPLGSVVEITLRNKKVQALVIHSASAADMKAILRGGDFALRRIESTTPREMLSTGFIEAAVSTAEYHASTTGSVLYSLIPKAILTEYTGSIVVRNIMKEKSIHDVYALQAPTADRLTMYKNTIRESLAQRRSVLLVASNIADATKLYSELSNGIEDMVFLLTSKTTKKKLLETVETMANSKKPVLLISTPKYSMLLRQDIGTIIVEDESSTTYTTRKRPYINTVIFITKYAKNIGAKLILAGTVLSTYVHLEMRTGNISELAPLSTRHRSKVKVTVLDMRKKKEKITGKPLQNKKFLTISEDVEKIISKNINNNIGTLILAPRNGLAPITVCRDCKSTVTCKSCDTPVTLHKKSDNEREFLCSKCGESQESNTTCIYCNSWRLDTLGVGIELVEDHLHKLYKKSKIKRVDKKTTKTDKQIKDTVSKFNKEGGILLATQTVLPFIDEVDTAVVVSLDAMLSVPDFKIDERVFALLLKVKNITKNRLVVQTRMPDRSVLTLAANGEISDFMREELSLRKTLKYPPYTVMIKITSVGSKRQIIEDFQRIMPRLEEYGPRIFKQFHRINLSKFALHALLRIDTKKYPSSKLTELLKDIQPKFEVKIDIE